jgi:hypothetical protein
MIQLVNDGLAFPVLFNTPYDHHKEAHRLVNYTKWFTAEKVYQIYNYKPFEPVTSVWNNLDNTIAVCCWTFKCSSIVR